MEFPESKTLSSKNLDNDLAILVTDEVKKFHVASCVFVHVDCYKVGMGIRHDVRFPESVHLLYCKCGNIHWAKLSGFLRVPRKFSREYLATVK